MRVVCCRLGPIPDDSAIGRDTGTSGGTAGDAMHVRDLAEAPPAGPVPRPNDRNKMRECLMGVMRLVVLFAGVAASGLTLGAADPAGADCAPVGTVQFICGLSGPEDLAVVPGGR